MYFIFAWQNSVESYTFFIFKQLFTYVLIKENVLYRMDIRDVQKLIVTSSDETGGEGSSLVMWR